VIIPFGQAWRARTYVVPLRPCTTNHIYRLSASLFCEFHPLSQFTAFRIQCINDLANLLTMTGVGYVDFPDFRDGAEVPEMGCGKL
jgi:hypothetical protein